MKFDHPTIHKDIIDKFINVIRNSENMNSEFILLDRNAIPTNIRTDLPFDYFILNRREEEYSAVAEGEEIISYFYYYDKVKKDFILLEPYNDDEEFEHHEEYYEMLSYINNEIYFSYQINSYPHIKFDQADEFKKHLMTKYYKKLNENIDGNILKVFKEFSYDLFHETNDESYLVDNKSIIELYNDQKHKEYSMYTILIESKDKKDYYTMLVETFQNTDYLNNSVYKYNKDNNTFNEMSREQEQNEVVSHRREIYRIDYLEWYNNSKKVNKIFKTLNETRILSFKDFIK